MKKPRLLVLLDELPKHCEGGNLERRLVLLLGDKVGGVEINGFCALPYSADSLLNYALLGKNTYQDKFLKGVQKGCELFVGVKTSEKNFAGIKSKDGRFDIYQLGERGFDLAKQNNIPAIFLKKYDEDEVCYFVENNTE